MPTKDFHHCRLFPPSEVGGQGCRTTERESNGKTYLIRTCELKGKPGHWKEQSYLYSREIWSEGEAKSHFALSIYLPVSTWLPGHGVLEVTLPKTEEAKPKAKEVKIE